MPRPLIIIVGRELERAEGIRGAGYGAGRRYLECIARAGGLPVIVPPLDMADSPSIMSIDLLSRAEGVVLHGGGDIDPRHYGRSRTTDTLYGLNDRHDAMELAVVRAALDTERPILAICRGLQILNVARGGTLIQDLGGDEHRQRLHAVDLDQGSRVAKAMGTANPQKCHSFHHQAIDQLGTGLRITGRSADGVIEAVESTDAAWVVGVQWHPEDTAAEDPQQQGLFDALVVASQR